MAVTQPNINCFYLNYYFIFSQSILHRRNNKNGIVFSNITTHNMPKREKGVRPHKKNAEIIIVSIFCWLQRKKTTRFLMHFCLFLNLYLWTGKIGYSIRVGGHF